MEKNNATGTSWMSPASGTATSIAAAGGRVSRVADPAYIGLASQLMSLRQREGDAKAVGLCGVLPGAGTSTAAQHLALALAAGSVGGRVLLVDVSGSPNGRSTRIQGWAELLRGDAELSDVLQPTSEPLVSRLYFIQDPHVGSMPMDGVRIKHLLQALKEQFEWIVFDLPSGARADALPVASALDGVLLILEAHRTKSQDARLVKHRLEQAGVHLVGVVLTKARSFVPNFIRRWLPRKRVV